MIEQPRSNRSNQPDPSYLCCLSRVEATEAREEYESKSHIHMTNASLRHRGGLAEHLKAAGRSTDDNDLDVDDHHETSSVATVRTTNRSSSKSRRFYFKVIITFVLFEFVLVVAYYGWPRLAGAASKTPSMGTRGRGISTKATSTGRSTGANLTSKIITAGNREVRHGSLQQIIASHKQTNRDRVAVNAVSKRWLENDISGLTALDARRLIVVGAKGAVQGILNETVCAPESAVMSQPNNAKSIGEVIDLLARKDVEGKAKAMALLSQLIYAAIHENQYGPARNEALKHMNENSDAISFSIECPDAKYLIFEGFTAPTGLGSHLRTRMAIPTFLTGLAHGRIVLYTKVGERTPMTIVNCDRGDLQCSFLPMSPCLPSMGDIQSAMVVAKDWDNTLLNHTEQRVIKLSRAVERDFAAALKVGETGKLKIVENFFTPDQRKWRMDNLVTAVARTVANNLYDAPGKADDLAATFQQMMEAEEFQSRVIAAAQLFITRPNRKTRSQIQEAMNSSFPPQYNPKAALGIPLRGSDKCLKEQKCAHFGRLIEQAHNEFPMDDLRHLVVTSEDAKYLDDAVLWKVMNGKKSSGHLELVMNKDDVMQATGQLQYLLDKPIPMEDIMTSTMTAWAFQLRAGLSFLNICSNFHRLFEGSIDFGCAAAKAWKRQDVECNVVV